MLYTLLYKEKACFRRKLNEKNPFPESVFYSASLLCLSALTLMMKFFAE